MSEIVTKKFMKIVYDGIGKEKSKRWERLFQQKRETSHNILFNQI